jgi:arylsulfatase A-like enzyme
MMRPNILWISLEDTSPRFGCYGDKLARTPNIDRLAAEGCRYPLAFSTAGVCAPSRSAIITGMYAVSIGSHHMRTAHTNEYTPELPTPYEAVPPAYVKTFTEYLRAAGYYCTNNFKTDYQFAPPVTAWDECGKEAHWRHREDGQPFFAVFNPTITHESGMWAKPDKPPLVTDPSKIQLPPYLPDTAKGREALARHYDNVAAADQVVGNLLRQLEQDGLADNTIVFIWSDHGEGLPRSKRWPYDGGIRIPMIVRWPGRLSGGSVSDRLVSLIDLGPTVLSLAGVDVPLHMQGVPFLGGQDHGEREYIFATRDRYDESYDMVRAVRDRRYKYIRNFYPEKTYLPWIPFLNRHPIMQEMWRMKAENRLEGEQLLMFAPHRPVEELYDCEADPYEMHNLAGDPESLPLLQRMRAAMEDWRRNVGDKGEIPESLMVEQMWPGGKQPVTATPIFIPLGPGHSGMEALTEREAEYDDPTLLQLHCATQGASIAYTFEEGAPVHWRLYTEPLRLPAGTSTLRAKAIRIGYKESAQRQVTFKINGV